MPARRHLLGGALGALLLVLAVCPSAGQAGSPGAPDPIYTNHSYSPAERAADLVSRMTLAEKASQMVSSSSPAIPRLGIKPWGWWNEANHGIAQIQEHPGYGDQAVNTTSYPDDLALGSSWDPGLMYVEAAQIGDEAREVMPQNFLNMDFFAPTVNLSRDPRWGRNDETFSEDPLLTADMASQFVDGLQGQNQNGKPLAEGGGYLKAIATLKHYAANNDETNRQTGSSNMDERTLREYYTSQFDQIIEQSHPGAIMTAFNEVNGTPASASSKLMNTFARETFGFTGYFTSDCDSVDDIVSGHNWRPPGYSRPANETEARAIADAAGEDLNCNLPYNEYNYANTLPAAVSDGIRTPVDTYNVQDMDTSLVRLFTARMELGEFDNINNEPWVKQARSQLAGFHWTNANTNGAITETPFRLNLAQYVGDRTQVLLKNNTIKQRDGGVGPLLPIPVPRSGPFKVAVIGYLANPSSMYLGGYSSYQSLAGQAREVNDYVGIRSEIQNLDPSAQVDYLKGFTNGNSAGTLTNIDQNAVTAAANYNYVIVVVGTDLSTAHEGLDRTNLAMPGAQTQLIDEVEQNNPNTIVVMQTIGDVDVTNFAGNAPAMLWSSYNGEREGLSLADVLLGYYNPSGHLPFTWYENESQLPPIDDYRIRPGDGTHGRTYMYFRGPVTYPFGYGLSYTTFKTSDLHLNRLHLTPNETLDATVNVTNTGGRAGEDLVQLYISTPKAPAGAQRPIKRLEGFRQVELAPGQTTTVKLSLKVLKLAFWNTPASRYTVDSGLYDVQIGSSADDVLVQRYVTVGGRLITTPATVTAQPTMPGDAARGIQQRAMFPEDTVIQPQLTVSMNDESLYGYIRAGHRRSLPAGMTVRYATDHSNVVSIKGDTLRTGSNGVATVTVAVTYHGVTAYGTFVVRVLSEVSGITIRLPVAKPPKPAKGKKKQKPPAPNYVPLPGFYPDLYSYNVVVPYGDPAPKINATNPDKSAHMHIGQAAHVPGVARVRITGPDGIMLMYTIDFARPAKSQSFTGRSVGSQWQWIGQDPTNEVVRDGSLQITAEHGDLSGTVGLPHNLLVQPALGNWTINTRMRFSTPPSVPTQQGGIIAYQDAQNWLKLDWEYVAGVGPELVETSEDNLSGAPVSEVLATYPTAGRVKNVLWLRMVKRGARYTTLFSTNGRRFRPIYNAGASLTDAETGLFAFGGADASENMTVSFAYFHVSNSGPIDYGSLH